MEYLFGKSYPKYCKTIEADSIEFAIYKFTYPQEFCKTFEKQF